MKFRFDHYDTTEDTYKIQIYFRHPIYQNALYICADILGLFEILGCTLSNQPEICWRISIYPSELLEFFQIFLYCDLQLCVLLFKESSGGKEFITRGKKIKILGFCLF